MKIKTKKTMNLPQLIEWAYHKGSDVRDEKIKSESMTVTFSEIGNPHIETKFHFLQVDELFTVEVVEEITEDTVIPKMLLKGRYTGYYEVEDCKLRGFNENLLQAYILNDDLTMTLIWRDGKLVE